MSNSWHGHGMKVRELKTKIEVFRDELRDHRALWGQSLNRTIPEYPVKNIPELERQTDSLSRQAGLLRPYIDRFVESTTMHHPATGASGDVLRSATGMEVAPVKGPSINGVLQLLQQTLGRLDSLNEDDDVPEEASRAIRPTAELQTFITAYLVHLHPFIRSSCEQLYLDGHSAQAVEEAAKAVLQYVRNKSGLSSDGAALIDAAFSLNKPILAFSDLSDETKRNEQLGFMEMLKGFARGVRNVLAHTSGRKEEAQRAFEYLVTASLFCRRVDEASPVSGKT